MQTDGILGTTVTWTHFERCLKQALSTEATLGHRKSVLDIGDGNGYSSCCGLITCDWIGENVDESLPMTVVLKIPSFLGLRRLNDSLPAGSKMFDYGEEQWMDMEANLFEIHNTEVAAYRFFGDFEDLAVPKMHYGKEIVDGTTGQLCIDFVSNARMMAFYEKHSVEQVKQIARALGKIQACSLKKEITAPEMTKNFFGNMENACPLETYRGMFKGILTFDSSPKTAQLMARIDEILPRYHGSNLISTIHKQLGFRPVIVNGDLHTGNVLVDKNTGDVAALIDWQCAHIGVGIEDLHRIAMSALMPDDRRTAMSSLVEEMHASLVRNLDDVDPPYSLDTAHLVSDLLFPHCALYFVGVFIAMIAEKDPRIGEEEKNMREGTKLDKVIGILEDVLKCDRENNNRQLEYKFK